MCTTITAQWVLLVALADLSRHRPSKQPKGHALFFLVDHGHPEMLSALGAEEVRDLCSRAVVGWSMADHMRAELVNQALSMALYRRQPAAGLIMHTDRGSQYGAESYRQLLHQHEICPSMSRKGNCWDNAVAESFFHTLKTELVYVEGFNTHEQA